MNPIAKFYEAKMGKLETLVIKQHKENTWGGCYYVIAKSDYPVEVHPTHVIIQTPGNPIWVCGASCYREKLEPFLKEGYTIGKIDIYGHPGPNNDKLFLIRDEDQSMRFGFLPNEIIHSNTRCYYPGIWVLREVREEDLDKFDERWGI